MLENQYTNHNFNDTKALTRSKGMFYGTILTTFALTVIVTVALSFLFFKIATVRYYETTQLIVGDLNFILMTAAIGVLTFVVIILMWFMSPRRRILTFISIPIFILYFSIIIGYGLSFGVNKAGFDANVILAIFFIPGLILLIAGILGICRLVHIKTIWLLSGILFAGLIIAIIVSVVYARAYWWIPTIAIASISVTSIISFWNIRTTADNIQFASTSEIISHGIYYGVQMFIFYIQLVRLLMDYFVLDR
ncbi:MAG0110 family membrane protein [Mycoplasma corogypsi]|uniref:MAG0110 family membrane protein n=1 Tax=Mycoplasma corogypsi TaxID=2106 RepID=UPI003872EBB0